MIKRFRLFSLLLLVAVALPSLSCKEIMKYAERQKPKLKYNGLKLRNISFRGMTMDFNFLLDNPNPFGVNFSRVAYQLDFNGNKLFSGHQKKGVNIKANGRSPFVMPFSIEYVKFVKSLIGFFRGNKQVPYALALKFGFMVPVINKEIVLPFQTKGNVPVPSVPKIRVIGATKPQFTGGLLNAGVTFNFKVGMKNENRFPINVQGLQYAFRISGKPVVSGTTRTMGVTAGNEQIVNIPVTIRVAQVGMAVFNMIRSGRFQYDFGGKLNLGLFKLPFNLKGNLKI